METVNIFSEKGKNSVLERINKLQKNSTPEWGKMNVGQMLAHVNIGFDEEKQGEPNALARFFLKLFVKPVVIGDKPFKKNSRTAPYFIIDGERDFETEKNKLIENVEKVFSLGESHFDGKKSNSFGILNKNEWNNLFYKHIDHHLRQFGV